MEENTLPNYCLTKTNGGKTRKQLQANSPKAKSAEFLSIESSILRNEILRNAPKATPFKIK